MCVSARQCMARSTETDYELLGQILERSTTVERQLLSLVDPVFSTFCLYFLIGNSSRYVRASSVMLRQNEGDDGLLSCDAIKKIGMPIYLTTNLFWLDTFTDDGEWLEVLLDENDDLRCQVRKCRAGIRPNPRTCILPESDRRCLIWFAWLWPTWQKGSHNHSIFLPPASRLRQVIQERGVARDDQ